MNYIDTMKECKGCGKIIYKKDYKSSSNKKWDHKQFCNRSCYFSYRKLKYLVKEEEDPNNRKKCKGCGKIIYRKDYKAHKKEWGEKLFCSHPCYIKNREEAIEKMRSTIKKGFEEGREVWNKDKPMNKNTKLKVSKSKRRYEVNEDFFKKWNQGMAYVFGWFISDGNLAIKNRQLRFRLADKEVLENIKEIMQTEQPISESIGGGYTKNSTIYNLTITSFEICEDLKELGINPGKENFYKNYNVPDIYFSHFFRGVFEGDGGVYFNPINKGLRAEITNNSEIFLETLREKVYSLANVDMRIIPVKGKIAYRLQSSSNDRNLKLFHFLYPHPNVYKLKRKYDVFEDYFKNRIT